METYHKIQSIFKRDMANKGKMIHGEWTTPELEYLAGNQWEFTEKVDGTNIRVGLSRYRNTFEVDVRYGGRSDNAVIPTPLMEKLHDIFEVAPGTVRSHILEWIIDNDLSNVVLFGEGYGPKIQGGGKYREDVSFVLFDVKIGDWWLHRKDVDDIASKLGIDSVPVIGHGTLHQAINQVRFGTPYLPEEVRNLEKKTPSIFDWAKPMRSTWGDFEAEGIVARPVVPLFDRKGNRIIVKIKGVDFK